MTVAIKRRSDGRYLLNWGGGVLRWSETHFARFRSEGHAESVIRIDLGRDPADFDIVDPRQQTVPAANSYRASREPLRETAPTQRRA